MNENIIPYVPLEPRVQAKTEKSRIMCQQLFRIIDQSVQAQITFNHDTEKGRLSISPDQINDLLQEVSKTEQLSTTIDIEVLKISLNDLIYPKFMGEHTVTSPIWSGTSVRVWQFQLNQIAQRVNMEISQNDAELMLDSSISTLRIWRQSLEAAPGNRDVTYQTTDLVYKLLDLEHRLQQVQSRLEK
ncbi:hypothetical protein ABLT80_09085 [Acinetobacter schindleri]|uniref:hypothetical protein n=1 Tax=Acinetobacter schindleri TaxID=108981 RepID=UPI0032B5A1A1